MNISSISNYNYANSANFKGNVKKAEVDKTTGKISFDLPDSSKYDYAPLFTDPKQGSKLQAEYKEKLMNICFDKEGNVNPVIKKKLDESHFLFEQPDGSSKVMTIKEALQSYAISSKPVDMELFHATYLKENAENIVKKGFDPKKISRTEFGPGFYFTPSEGDAMNYGSAKVQVKVKGNCAHMDGKFYEKINNNNIHQAVKKFVGLNSMGYPTQEIERNVTNTVINEYVRNVLSNELGYDCAYGAGGGKACFVVFNPKAISDIKLF